MNRRQFEFSCRLIATQLGSRKKMFSDAIHYEYSDKALTISCFSKGIVITVRETGKPNGKPVIATVDERFQFFRPWKKYINHVAKLAVFDLLAEV